MIIRNFGSDERCRITEKILSERLSGIREIDGIGRILLLPIPSSRDGVYITNSTLRLGEVLLATDSETLVAGYSIPEAAAEMLGETGAAVYDGAIDEKLLSANAELTADATLGILLTELGKSIAECRIAVIGWGRIGSRLGAKLLFLGADITVFTSAEDKRLELGRLGIASRESEEGKIDLNGFDAVINTSPARLFGKEESDAAGNPKIYDLASGKLFGGVKNAVSLPSLPSRYYPYSSARIYAERIAAALGTTTEEYL